MRSQISEIQDFSTFLDCRQGVPGEAETLYEHSVCRNMGFNIKEYISKRKIHFDFFMFVILPVKIFVSD